MEEHKSEYKFNVTDLIKQSRPGYHNPKIVLKAYPPDRRLCVFTVITEYLKRTSVYRKYKQLILSYSKPYKSVTASTISRWIKTCLARSGIDVNLYTAHSVRSASVSKAKKQCVPIDEILSKAGWSNVKTFAIYYDKQIEKDGTFAESVLSV